MNFNTDGIDDDLNDGGTTNGLTTDTLTAANRLSIRAVLVYDGQDAAPDLIGCGIFDPVSIPVTDADAAFGSGAILGDGVTPNVIGILEQDDQQEDHDPAQAFAQPDAERSEQGRTEDWDQPKTVTLPGAYGLKPLAPVWKPPG